MTFSAIFSKTTELTQPRSEESAGGFTCKPIRIREIYSFIDILIFRCRDWLQSPGWFHNRPTLVTFGRCSNNPSTRWYFSCSLARFHVKTASRLCKARQSSQSCLWIQKSEVHGYPQKEIYAVIRKNIVRLLSFTFQVVFAWKDTIIFLKPFQERGKFRGK